MGQRAFCNGKEKVQALGWCGVPAVRWLSSHLLLPTDSLQLASKAHAVPQADETLSEALVYGVTAPWARCSCCQGRDKD